MKNETQELNVKRPSKEAQKLAVDIWRAAINDGKGDGLDPVSAAFLIDDLVRDETEDWKKYVKHQSKMSWILILTLSIAFVILLLTMAINPF